MVPFIDRARIGFLSEPTPQASTTAGDLTHQGIHQQTQGEQRQSKIDQAPQQYPQGKSRFFQAMAHHGLIFSTSAKGVQHGNSVVVGTRILGA
jgi:hypothetical protein